MATDSDTAWVGQPTSRGKVAFRRTTVGAMRAMGVIPVLERDLSPELDKRKPEAPAEDGIDEDWNETPDPGDITWHHNGKSHRYGRDAHGHDFEQDRASGKVKRIHSQNEMARIVAFARLPGQGAASAARRYCTPVTQVRQWMTRGK